MKGIQISLVVVIGATIVLSLFFPTGVLSETRTPRATPTPRTIVVKDKKGDVTVTIKPAQGATQADVDKVWSELGAAIVTSAKMKAKVIAGGQVHNHKNSIIVNVHRDNPSVTNGRNYPSYSNQVDVDLGDIEAMRSFLTGGYVSDVDKILQGRLIEIIAHEVNHTAGAPDPDIDKGDDPDDPKWVEFENKVLEELGLGFRRRSYGYCHWLLKPKGTFIDFIVGSVIVKWNYSDFDKARRDEKKYADELCPCFTTYNPRPVPGAKHVRPDTELCFQPPTNALCIDPNADPNLKGPFDFYVYFKADDPCNMPLVAEFTDVDTSDQMCVNVGATLPGVTYYWRVDVNDHNEPGDPCFYEGPLFMFTTWGYAINPNPEDGAADMWPSVDPNWQNDGYASEFDAFFGDDEDDVDASEEGALVGDTQGFYDIPAGNEDQGINPGALEFGKTYYWRVDECNTPFGCVHGHIWSFSTGLCDPIDDFEAYTGSGGSNPIEDYANGNWGAYNSSPPVPDWYNYGDVYCQTVWDDAELVCEGDKSMKFRWDGCCTIDYYALVQREFNPELDLPARGTKSISIMYRASDIECPPFEDDTLYMELVDIDTEKARVDYTGDVCDPCWATWYIALSEFTDDNADIQLDKIKYVRIGAETDHRVRCFLYTYWDMLMRCAPFCRPEFGPVGDLTGNCFVGYEDLDIMARDWLVDNNSPTWTQVNIDGFGDPNNIWATPNVVFNGRLYAGTWNDATAGQIFSTSNGTTWTQVNIDGFGDPNNLGTYPHIVFDGYLYASGENEVTGGEIWRSSDGTTWDQVNIDGFGDPNNIDAEPGAVFEGNVYAGTANEVTGAEIWRSSDGTTWTQVNIDGFGDPNNIDAEPGAVFEGNLYAGTANEVTGAEIWRSSDGTTWDQVNIDGFGDPNNIDAKPGAVFEGNVYTGTANEVTGDEIWMLSGQSVADLYYDDIINFKDYAILANHWLEEQLWP